MLGRLLEAMLRGGWMSCSNRLFSFWLRECTIGLLVGHVALFAQIGTGSISGTVTDKSGSSLAGVSVTIKNTQTGVVTLASVNDQGRFVAPDLVVGSYDVQAQMPGFQTQVHSGIVLTVGSNTVVDFSLPVGQLAETIVVEGATTQVETTSSEISALVTQKQMQDLPLNGRDFEQLILLAPGVQTVTTGAQSSFYGRAPSYSIAGSRPEGQELLLDGADIQGFWNHGAGNSIIGTSLGVEAIGEFQVLTNSYSARFGGSGSVMNATTRSGTNSFHGAVYDFLRNNVFDARNYFNTTAFPQNPYRQNQFGGALGGPVKKDKMFFFVNYEGIRRLLGETFLPAVPDAAARQGDLPDCVVNPGALCNQSKLDSLPLNPASQAIMALYPTGRTEIPLPGAQGLCGSPTCGPSGLDQITVNGVSPANEDYVTARWDYVFSSSNTIFARYVFDNGSLSDPSVSPVGLYPEESQGRNQYITIGDKNVFASNLVNDARFSFVRTNMRAFVTAENPVLQFFSYYGEDRQDGTVTIAGGPTSVGPSAFTPDFEIQNTFSLADDVFWTHGNHSIEIGLEFRRLQSPLENGFFSDQGWSFPSYASFIEGQEVNPTAPAITLLGALPGKDNSNRSFREFDLFPYIQDTWRVSRTLTLNLGLRYEFISNPTETHNELCAFIDPSSPTTTGCTPVSHVFPSNPSLKNIDPRVGFAWDPLKDHKTSIRGGAGVFHDPIQVRNYHPAYLFAGPFQTGVSVCVFGVPCSYPIPFLGITAPVVTIGEALEYDPRVTPFVLQYNFGVQHEIAKNTVLSVSYVGSRGYNLLVQNDLNPEIPVIVDGQPTFPLGVPRNNPNLGAIAFNVPDGLSWYNSLQAYVTRNFSNNLQFQFSYTYSKCIDYGSISYGLEASNSGQQAQSDPYDLARDKGVCDFDVRHNFVANSIYTLPFRSNVFIEGWRFGGILTARSGSPFSIQDGIDQANLNNPAGQPGERPNLLPEFSNNPIVGKVGEWFNPSAFALQPFGTIGDLGRNTLVGPRFVDLDLSLSKVTPIKENMNLEFRAEAFNIFNHPNFALPNATLTSPLVGQILSTVGTARQLQLALKFNF
jgi:Carboxypeptidase regulatory-like domain/TonB-dependent Receptor Plug Domain